MQVLSRRFDELLKQVEEVESTQTFKYSEFSGNYPHIDGDKILNWSVKAKSLIAKACGKDSEHYAAFSVAEEPQSYEDNVTRLKRIKAVFSAAHEDFEGGYFNTIRNFVHAELAGDELEQAQELLNSGYSAAAAVVAGVVLETTLRTLCSRRGITISSIDRMNADLTKAGEYNSLIQKRIAALAAVRNSAAHGKSHEYETADVANLIVEVNRFVASVLS